MFGLKKKKEEPAPVSAKQESQEYKAFAADFLPEETDILAVTGPTGFGSERDGDEGLWRCAIGLTAWMDEYKQELHQEEVQLVALADDRLREYLHERTPRDNIISVTVRPSADGKRFLMTDLPKPGFDPELKALLEEQKKPDTREAKGLGTFTLNRALGWFEGTVDWLGSEVSLTFDRSEETISAAQDTARALLDSPEDWDARLRACAAVQLLEQVNGWAEEDEEQEPLTQEEFMEQLEPEALQAGPEGTFEFWFGGEPLWGRSVHITGDLEYGPRQAEIEE